MNIFIPPKVIARMNLSHALQESFALESQLLRLHDDS